MPRSGRGADITGSTSKDRTRLIDYYDLGQATYAMMLAAADLGVGHSSVGDQDRAREILNVPAGHDVAFLIGLGYRPTGRCVPRPSRTAARSAR